MSSKLPEGTKKAYQRPELCVYGDVSEITRIMGNKGGADGGVSPFGKSMAG